MCLGGTTIITESISETQRLGPLLGANTKSSNQLPRLDTPTQGHTMTRIRNKQLQIHFSIRWYYLSPSLDKRIVHVETWRWGWNDNHVFRQGASTTNNARKTTTITASRTLNFARLWHYDIGHKRWWLASTKIGCSCPKPMQLHELETRGFKSLRRNLSIRQYSRISSKEGIVLIEPHDVVKTQQLNHILRRSASPTNSARSKCKRPGTAFITSSSYH